MNTGNISIWIGQVNAKSDTTADKVIREKESYRRWPLYTSSDHTTINIMVYHSM
jgi:hypothetical protein